MVQVARAPLAVLPNVGMSQSSVMLAALLAGFVVYLAVKQRLGVYWSIMIGGGAAASSTTPAATSSTAPSSTAPSSTAPINPGVTLNPFSGLLGGSSDPLFGPGAIFGPKASQ